MIKRHTRPSQVPGAQSEAALGGVIEREGPIHVANAVGLEAEGQPTRIKIEREDGRRFRVAKTTAPGWTARCPPPPTRPRPA